MNDEGGGASRSTDPASGTSSATDVSLREFLSTQIENSRRECKDNIDSLRRQFLAAEEANAEAITTALLAIDRRFDSVNEFRHALSDLSKQMATQISVNNLADKVVASDEALEARFEALYQRNRDDITVIMKRLDLREGQSQGSKVTTGIFVTCVTIGVGVIGLVVVLANYFSSH